MKYLAGFIFALGSIITWIMSLLRAGSLPERMPMHWNLQGQVDRYGSKTEALYFLPIFALGMSLLFMLIGVVAGPRLRPNTTKALNIVAAAMVTFFIVIHNLVLSANATQATTVIPGMMSGLLIVLGFAVRGIEPNPLVGVRVPWTMNNPNVWRKTHDRASRLWIGGGIACLILNLIGMPFPITIGAFILLVMYPLLDSYRIWKMGL